MGATLKCLKCGDIIRSTFRHDFRYCSCYNIFVDGGNDYLRIGGPGIDDNTYIIIKENTNDSTGTDKSNKRKS